MGTLNQDRAARRIEAEAKRPIQIEVTDDPFERFRALDPETGYLAIADTAAKLRRILKIHGVL